MTTTIHTSTKSYTLPAKDIIINDQFLILDITNSNGERPLVLPFQAVIQIEYHR